MKNCLIVSALGTQRPGLVSELTRAVFECECHILNSRMLALGGEFAAILLVQGNWNTLAKLEVQLKRLEQPLGMSILCKRTEERKRQGDMAPYAVEVIALNHPGIVYRLVNFFNSRSISIEELSSHSYPAPHTGAPMFSVNIAIGVPTDTHIAMLREEFMDFCDEFNLDAVLEPIKG